MFYRVFRDDGKQDYLRREPQLCSYQEKGGPRARLGAGYLLLLGVVAGVSVASGQGPGTAGRQSTAWG